MEVLIMLSNEAPHIYLHNGVSYSDMELMASVLLNSLAESEKGTVSILFHKINLTKSVTLRVCT